jgi:hypothetical protein
MKYIEYNLTDENGKSNCVIRTFSKIFNKSYKEVLNDLIDTAKELGCESFNDIPVFEKYMEVNGITKETVEGDIKVKDLSLDEGTYVVFCYDKKDFYHMIPIIDNTVYDKHDDSLELYVISLYKENSLRLK